MAIRKARKGKKKLDRISHTPTILMSKNASLVLKKMVVIKREPRQKRTQ